MDSYKKEGVLLLQLGSPKSCATEDVKEYLLSFLGDSHTVGAPPLIWKPLLRYFIAPSRAAKSAQKYQEMCEIQGVEEMPLITYTRQFAEGVQAELHNRAVVRYAFQYGASPSISEALDDLVREGVAQVRVIPLYPQRSGATSLAALDQLKEVQAYTHHCIFVHAMVLPNTLRGLRMWYSPLDLIKKILLIRF